MIGIYQTKTDQKPDISTAIQLSSSVAQYKTEEWCHLSTLVTVRNVADSLHGSDNTQYACMMVGLPS